MQKTLIVQDVTPTVTAWLHLGSQLIGVTDAGEHILLANVQSLPAEKPKQRRRKVDPRMDANGEAPRRRGRKPLGRSPLQTDGAEALPATFGRD